MVHYTTVSGSTRPMPPFCVTGMLFGALFLCLLFPIHPCQSVIMLLHVTPGSLLAICTDGERRNVGYSLHISDYHLANSWAASHHNAVLLCRSGLGLSTSISSSFKCKCHHQCFATHDVLSHFDGSAYVALLATTSTWYNLRSCWMSGDTCTKFVLCLSDRWLYDCALIDRFVGRSSRS